jgi:hypothetical protein
VVLVKGSVHLFGITIGAVMVQGDADMLDEFTQTRLVVRGNTFLRVPAGTAHAHNAKACTRARATGGCGISAIRVAAPRRPRRLIQADARQRGRLGRFSVQDFDQSRDIHGTLGRVGWTGIVTVLHARHDRGTGAQVPACFKTRRQIEPRFGC